MKRSEKKAEKSMFLTKPMHVQMRAAKKQGYVELFQKLILRGLQSTGGHMRQAGKTGADSRRKFQPLFMWDFRLTLTAIFIVFADWRVQIQAHGKELMCTIR